MTQLSRLAMERDLVQSPHGRNTVLTVHLAFVRQNDLATATGRIDCQGLLEALFDVRAPYTLRVRGCQILVILERSTNVKTVAHFRIAHDYTF